MDKKPEDRNKASELINSAIAIAKLFQGLTCESARDEGIALSAAQITGVYFILDDLIEKLKQADALI